MKRPARGIALITALLVVAIATLAATALLSTANLAIHRTASLRDSEQGWWVSRGVESWVLGILQKDAKDNTWDGFDDTWAVPVDYLPVDQGYVKGLVVDLHRCLNLNNMLLEPARAKEHRAQLERLVAGLQLREPVEPGFSAVLLDWIDADQNPGHPGGAEDGAYLGLDPPYRTANRPFTVVSELLAVKGMTAELYARLRENNRVCALPVPTRVNVNTADELVLRALSATQPDPGKFQRFLERRQTEPLQSAAEIFTETGLAVDAKDFVDVKSQYFQIQGEVFVGSSRVALYSLIHRPDAGAPTVLAHSADAE